MKKKIIHYFTEYTNITVKGNTIKRTTEVYIACGAKEGEADNRKRYVTCVKCLGIIESDESYKKASLIQDLKEGY